ncbi:hypothetical protein LSUE1_G010334, partial [Lachnellula suecica]
MAIPPRPAFVSGNFLAASIYDLISDYVSSPARNAPSTAISLTSLMAPYMSSASDLQSICHLWGVLFFMATTYHPSSPKHSLLVDLVLEIRKCSAPPYAELLAYEKQWGCRFWTDLPMWEAVWSDFEFDAPLVPRMAERKADWGLLENRFLPGPWRNRDGEAMASVAWASLNAFGARLHAQTDLELFDSRALSALVEALEENRSAKALDDIVPAAACWILYAGKTIKDSSTSHCTKGDMCSGEKGPSNERWSSWKLRLGDLTDRTDIKRNTRIYAKQARDEMQRLDSGSTVSEERKLF